MLFSASCNKVSGDFDGYVLFQTAFNIDWKQQIRGLNKHFTFLLIGITDTPSFVVKILLTQDPSSSIATAQKEVPIKSIRIFEVDHQVFRSHKSGYASL